MGGREQCINLICFVALAANLTIFPSEALLNRNIVGVLDLKNKQTKEWFKYLKRVRPEFIGLLNVSIAMEACVAASVHRQEQLQSLCGNTYWRFASETSKMPEK